ncbi:MAG: GTPase Era [Gammaproteobacteria bacterium]|nr:MAG: GTPase Era [Gammaproteobacteria bacterium]
MNEAATTRCGLVAVVGRPNVGKSTLVNALVGQKVSIVTPKPQTTRHRILGIKTRPDVQLVLVDTPGLHLDQKHALNRYMNRAALAAVADVDAVLLVVEPGRWGAPEDRLLEALAGFSGPVVVALNKIDTLRNKALLLPEIEALAARGDFAAIVPVSARLGDGLDRLENVLFERLPPGPFLYEPDQISDKPLRFIAAELLREQLFLALHQELPYALTVEIEAFEEEEGLIRIAAVIWVAKRSHKAIVIGRGGERLKDVGRRARLAMREAFGKPVHLRTWVKVREDWHDDERALRSLGYHGD